MEDTTTAQPQAGSTDAAQPQAGAATLAPETTPAPAVEAPEAPITSTSQLVEDEDAPITLRAARELRREHQQLRRDLEAAHAAREAAAAKLTELEPFTVRVKELEEALADAVIRGEVAKTAPSLGFADTEDALLFIQDEIEVKEDGTTNVGDLLSALAKSKPYLVNTPRSIASGAVTNTPRAIEPNSVNELDGLSKSEIFENLQRMVRRTR